VRQIISTHSKHLRLVACIRLNGKPKLNKNTYSIRDANDELKQYNMLTFVADE
jgi:hypothetical protein